MSAEDDDDDIWNSDNFIATVEVFLQKAEHESAVKHGTQSVVPTASSNFPGTSRSTYSNGPNFKIGPSVADPKPSYGSSAPPPGYSGRVADFPIVGQQIRANESAGRTPVVQPLNYQNPWTVPEVRDVYASHQLNGLGHDHSGNLQLAVLENDNPELRDILAEKDGAISLLRTRLREAEQQVDEFRRRVSSQTSLQPTISQQRELERLSSQLLFKEHEVNEVRRVRLEKEEQLKGALAEAASLRQELQHLKQSRSTGADGSKRSREEGASLQKNTVDRYAVTSGPYASMENNTRTLEAQQDPWTSPWMPEKVSNDAPRKIYQGSEEKNATEICNRLEASDASPAVATLKKRTAENGCVSSNKNESKEREQPKTAELDKRKTSAQSKETETAAGMSELSYSLQHIWGFRGVKNEGKALVAKIYANCAQDLYILLSSGENKRLVDCKKMERRKSEPLTLSEKFHNAIAKVTNGCAPPKIILGPLLEFCEMENAKLLGSALRVLHCILQHDDRCRQRLVGRTQGYDRQCPSTVFSHLEETDNVEEAKCGFKVVSNSLANGETKQVPVFSSPRIIIRSRWETPETRVTSKRGAVDKLKKLGDPEISANLDQQQLREAQHIEVEYRAKKDAAQDTSDTTDLSKRVDLGSVKISPVDQQQSQARQQTDVAVEAQIGGGRGTNSYDEELDPFLKWMLHLALTSTSPVVRLEAVAVIGVLVVHSEPLVGRLMFGSLLNHDGLETLLRESAGVEIQLQARMLSMRACLVPGTLSAKITLIVVDHLSASLSRLDSHQVVDIVSPRQVLSNYCLPGPTLYRKFCTSITDEQTVVPNEFCEVTRMVVEDPLVVEDNNLGSTADQRVGAPAVAKGCTLGSSAGLMKRKLLAGLADCLNFTGTSLQGYALRRSVMRLITYIASCGDAGVAFLTQPITCGRSGADESTRICKDNPKAADGMPLSESASGQHIAGDGSGIKGLDIRGRMIPGTDDVEGGLVDNREDLERVMNIPERLVSLLGAELESQDEGESETSLVEERACLIREVATLLSCLASHPVQSGVVLGFLISNPRIARLTLSVTNDLVSRKSPLQVSGTGQKHAGLSNSETAELCRSLRRRVMRAIAEASEPQS